MESGVLEALLHDCWQRREPSTIWSARLLRQSGGALDEALQVQLCDALLLQTLRSGARPGALLQQYLDEALNTLFPLHILFHRIQTHCKGEPTVEAGTLMVALFLLNRYKSSLYQVAAPRTVDDGERGEHEDVIQIDTRTSSLMSESASLYGICVFAAKHAALYNEGRDAVRLYDITITLLVSVFSSSSAVMRLLLHCASHPARWTDLKSVMNPIMTKCFSTSSSYMLCVLLQRHWSALNESWNLGRFTLPASSGMNPLRATSAHQQLSTHCSLALFCRLHSLSTRNSSPQAYCGRLCGLRELYGLSHYQLYVDVILCHLRECHQARDSSRQMQCASILFVFLPQVIKLIEERREAPTPEDTMELSAKPNDIELALCKVATFSELTASIFAEGVSWLDVLVDSLLQCKMLRIDVILPLLEHQLFSPSLFTSFALALPPVVAHGDPVTCSDITELAAVIDDVCISGKSGSSLSSEFVTTLLDMSLTRQTWCHRVQELVVTKLIPRLLQTQFELPLVVLNQLLNRLSSPACIHLVSMHGVLPQIVMSIVQIWGIEALKNNAEHLNLRIDVLSRCHYLLLFILSEYDVIDLDDKSTASFVALANGSPGLTVHPERHKSIAQRIVTVSTQTLPSNASWAEGMRKACAKVPAEDVLLTVRFVILPNMYAKVLEQEKYRSFLAMLLSAMPYIGSTIVEYICLLINEDIKKCKCIKKHLVVVDCLLTEIRKFGLPLLLEFFHRRFYRTLSLDRNADTSKMAATIFGTVQMSSIARYQDRSVLLQKHIDYLLRSHISAMSVSWKDTSLHLPILRTCQEILGDERFVSVLLEMLVSPARLHDSSSPQHRDCVAQLGDDLLAGETLRATELAASVLMVVGHKDLLRSAHLHNLPSLLASKALQSATNSHLPAAIALLSLLSYVLTGAHESGNPASAPDSKAAVASAAALSDCTSALSTCIVRDLQRLVEKYDPHLMLTPYAPPSFGVSALAMIGALARPNALVDALPRDRILPMLERLGLDELAVALHSIDELKQCSRFIVRVAATTAKQAAETPPPLL